MCYARHKVGQSGLLVVRECHKVNNHGAGRYTSSCCTGNSRARSKIGFCTSLLCLMAILCSDWFYVYVSYDKWTCRGMANWGQPAFLHAGKGDGCKTNGVAVAIFSKCVVLDSASLEVQGGEGESYPRASPHAEEEEFEDSTHARGTRAGTGGVRRPCLQTGGLLRKRRKFGIISGHGS